MKTQAFISILLAILIGSGFISSIAFAESKLYTAEDIEFIYPDDWKITEEESSEELHYIFVEHTGNTLLIIQVYSKEYAIPLEDYVEWFSSEADENTAIGSMDKNTFSYIEKPTKPGPSQGIREEFSISFLGMDIPHVREYFLLEGEKGIAYLVFQAPDYEFVTSEAGFNKILAQTSIK